MISVIKYSSCKLNILENSLKKYKKQVDMQEMKDKEKKKEKLNLT